MKTKQYDIVDSVDKLISTMEKTRAAQRKFATFTQEQVDRIFLAAASAANKARIPLAKLAVEETGMGVVEDKVIKNNYAAEYIYNAYKDTKTCGVIEEDKAFGIKKIAEPIGVIAAVIPTTNPTSTAIFKCLIALKTRNAIVISPHPRAKNSTIAAAKLVLEAAVAAGAPEGIIDWIDVPSLELTNTVMKEADIILATGGVSYPATGSTGEGHRMAGEVGHTVTPLQGSLVPLKEQGNLCARMQGLSLRNVSLTVFENEECWDACNSEFHSKVALFVNVDFTYNESSFVFFGNFSQNGSDHSARSTPGSPKVKNYGYFRV